MVMTNFGTNYGHSDESTNLILLHTMGMNIIQKLEQNNIYLYI